MADIRITQPRRLFASTISQFQNISFSELKKILVGKWEGKMDNTTLYRIIDTFKSQWLLHEVNTKWERILFLAGTYNPKSDAVHITVCENCGNIETKYTPLPNNITHSITENRTSSCNKCQK